MPSKFDFIEQEELYNELRCGMETMDEDEYEEKKSQLWKKYREKLEDDELDFADSAVGSESWRSDW